MKHALLLRLFFFPSTLVASGKIKGRVTDKQTMTPLIGAHIIVTGTSFRTAADQDGELIIFDLPAGVFTLKANFVGYASVTIENIGEYNDLTSEANFELTPEAVQFKEITVVAERESISGSGQWTSCSTTHSGLQNPLTTTTSIR
jgi:hypothetical protein